MSGIVGGGIKEQHDSVTPGGRRGGCADLDCVESTPPIRMGALVRYAAAVGRDTRRRIFTCLSALPPAAPARRGGARTDKSPATSRTPAQRARGVLHEQRHQPFHDPALTDEAHDLPGELVESGSGRPHAEYGLH